MTLFDGADFVLLVFVGIAGSRFRRRTKPGKSRSGTRDGIRNLRLRKLLAGRSRLKGDSLDFRPLEGPRLDAKFLDLVRRQSEFYVKHAEALAARSR